jgi:hypothetical protein
VSDGASQLLAAMRARHGAAVEFARLEARIGEFDKHSESLPHSGPELLEISRSLVLLLRTERALNERLAVFAMGIQEAGAITSEELNVLMGIG